MSFADECLHDATRECLGRLFNLFPSANGPGEKDLPWHFAVVVDFHGDRTGYLRLDFYGAARADITDSWVGGPVEEDDANDVAGELANILCCHVLPALFGSRGLFQVDSPRAVQSPPIPDGGAAARTSVTLPNGRLDARVVTGTP